MPTAEQAVEHPLLSQDNARNMKSQNGTLAHGNNAFTYATPEGHFGVGVCLAKGF